MKITIEKKSSDMAEAQSPRLRMFRNFFRSLKDLSIERVTEIVVYTTIFLVPLFFGLGRVSNVEFSKQALLVLFGLATLVLWFLGSLFRSRVTIRYSFVHIFAVIFLVFMIGSTAFSVWRWGSFWGWPQEVKENLLTYLVIFAFYFPVSHLLNKKGVEGIAKTLLISAAIVFLLGGLQLLGKFVFPLSFTKDKAFNTVGSVSSWSLLLATLVPISLAVSSTVKEKVWKIIFHVISFMLVIGIFLAGNNLSWISVLIGVSLYMTFVLWKATGESYKLLFLPALFFALSLGFGLLNIQLPTLPSPVIEVKPTQAATLDVSLSMMKDSVKSWFFGWGPGTFKYGWSQFRDSSLNQTMFWNTRFTRGSSDILEKVGTVGLPGALAYLLVLLSGLASMVMYVLDKEDTKSSREWLMGAGILGSFLSLSVTKFLTTHNTTLEFLWWLLLAVVIVLSTKKTREFTLSAESKVSFMFSFLGILIVTGGVFLFYLEGTRYIAEVRYAQAFLAQSIDEVAELMGEAINLNPQQESFWRGLSSYYMAEANEEINSDKSQEEKSQSVSRLIGNAVSAASRATLVNSTNVANWQSRAKTYQDIIGWSAGAFEWSIKSYDRALELEPDNPYLHVEKGITYMRQATSVEGEEASNYFAEAEGSLRKSLELKPDYAPATYQMAVLQQTKGDTKEAINTLENLKDMAPYLLDYNPLQDVGLAFQLGLLYYSSNDLNNAMDEFERAVSLDENYGNARYFLGLTYNRLGYVTAALEQFEVLEEADPDNELIQDMLRSIRSGESVPDETENPDETPIQEEPEEL